MLYGDFHLSGFMDGHIAEQFYSSDVLKFYGENYAYPLSEIENLQSDINFSCD